VESYIYIDTHIYTHLHTKMLKLNRITFIVTAVIFADVATIGGYYLYGDVHQSIYSTEQKRIGTGFFAATHALMYVAAVTFFVSFDNCQYMLFWLLPLVVVDVFALSSACANFQFVGLIVFHAMFLVYDLVYAIMLVPLIPYELFEYASATTVQTVKALKNNITLVTYIMCVDGILFVSYVIIMASVATQLFSGWVFSFDLINLGVALFVTVSTKRSEILTLLRYLVGTAVMTAVVFIVAMIEIRNQRPEQYPALTTLRILMTVCSFLYIAAAIFHLRQASNAEIGTTLYMLVHVLAPPLIYLQLCLVVTYPIFDSITPAESFNWFVFLHLLNVFVGLLMFTCRDDDVYWYIEAFAFCAFCITIYEIIMVIIYANAGRSTAVIIFEAVMLAIPAIYLGWYALIWLTVDYQDNKTFMEYASKLALQTQLNEYMQLLPAYQMPLWASRQMEGSGPYTAISDASKRAKGKNLMEKLFAIGIDRAIHMCFYVPYMMDIACMLAYVLGLLVSKQYEFWGAYGNIFHILTLLGGYYVLTIRIDIQKHIITQLAFAFALFIIDLIYLIDYYELQWFGGNYAGGFIALRYLFIVVDAVYIILCCGLMFKVPTNAYLYYAGMVTIDSAEAPNVINI
jgi:hypothetical protein